jgi:TonB family protein
MFLDRLLALVLRVGAAPLLMLVACGPESAHAQPAPSSAASAASGELTANERAQRDADKVFKWILIHSDKPRKQPPVREEKPVAVAPARPKPAPTRTAEAPAPATRATVPSASPKALVAGAATTPTAGAPAPGSETVLKALTEAELAAATPIANPTGGGVGLTAKAAAAEAKPDADEPLTAVLRADPQFPPALMRTLRTGRVQVRFTVVPDGSVGQRAVVTTTNSRLNEAALAAVAKWRFTPLRHAQEAAVELGFDLD